MAAGVVVDCSGVAVDASEVHATVGRGRFKDVCLEGAKAEEWKEQVPTVTSSSARLRLVHMMMADEREV